MKSKKNPGLFLIFLLSIATSCSVSNSEVEPETLNSSANTDQLKVVATFLPMYWFTKAVAGDVAQVDILVPPGSEVHEYQATPSNVQAIAQADVLVKNGLGFEEFLTDIIRNAQNSNLKEIDASQGMQALDATIPMIDPLVQTSDAHNDAHDHEHEDETTGEKTNHDHDHPEGNPHVWLDPVRAKQQVETIRDGLIAADPTHEAQYSANAAAYLQQLDQLHRQFETQLKPNQNCTFITFHNAFPYLAQRYQLQQVAVVSIPEASLSPADVQKTVEAVKQYDVKALFGEPGVDNKLLSSLSQDLNLTLHTLDSLESGELSPQYYFTAMQENLQKISDACRSMQ